MRNFSLLLLLLVGCGNITAKDMRICKDTCAFFHADELTTVSWDPYDGELICNCKVANKTISVEIPRSLKETYHSQSGRTESVDEGQGDS